MGTIGQHLYNGYGARLWGQVAKSPNYTVSRDSAELAESFSGDIMDLIPQGAELYLLGAGVRETRALASAGQEKLAHITVVDISHSIAEKQAAALQEVAGNIQVRSLYAEFQRASLGDPGKEYKRVIFYPSSNIGNIPGILGRPVSENKNIINLLKRFRENAGMLILGYDTTRQEDLLGACYSGQACDLFLINGVVSLGKGLGYKLNPAHLYRSSYWDEGSDAYIHRVITRKTQIIGKGESKIVLLEDSPIYAAHSYKFRPPANDNSPGDIGRLARKAGWAPASRPFVHEDGRTMIQAFEWDMG
ncbi:MAG: L-histidine N(alpha)-methyltransferase [Alphaproteobacteria bacterium]|nr:L-histidine N(alpha)-methyltransferase [Alphaproteobacteria bacterium]